MTIFLLLFPAIFSPLVAVSETASQLPQRACENEQSNHSLTCQLQHMKLKISQLEDVLEESIQKFNAKSLHLQRSEKLIEEMENKIHHLQSALSTIKDDSSRTNERLRALEEEVRLLWAQSRKNNFDIHVLESKTQEAEDRLEVVKLRVEQMADIVTEHWIQIRHLEQALQATEMRALEAQREVRFTRCSFLKLIKNIYGNHLQKVIGMLDPYLSGKGSILSFYGSHALHQLKRIFSAARKYHREFQGFIKQEMERNEFMAAFAHEEVVFFVASALITFPILSAWMLLSSQFC